MNKQLKKLRLGMMLFALPLATTAVVSAQQSVIDNSPATQATTSAQQVEGNRSHAVSLNRVGSIEGRISTGQQTGELNVYFVQDGQIVRRTRTTDGGYFVAENIAEGNYSFIATGSNGFAAYGVQVQPYDSRNLVNAMEAATVSPRFSGLKQILRSNIPAQIASEIAAIDQGNSPSGFTGSNVVELNDGRLSGRIATVNADRQSVRGTDVYIVQDDREVGRTQADQNGRFDVDNLQPGVYDFIAAGNTGIAAIRFQAISNDTDSGIIPVSYRKPVASAAAQSLDVCLTCQGDSGFVSEQIDYAAGNEVIMDSVPFDSTAPIEYASESVGCGCAAGGSCGSCGSYSGFGSGGGGVFNGGGVLRGGGGGGLFGGGGFGAGAGGSGFGRLITLGALAGGIVAIADDGNGAPGAASVSTTD